MSAAINAGYNQDLSSAVNQIISQVEYYEAILERKGLVKREGEFRNQKLCLVLDLLRSVDIPDNLKSELSSSIIRGWKLVVAEKNLSDRREELHIMIRGLKEVRNAADSTKKDPTPMNEHMLHTAILCALPLMRSDLTSEDMLNVRDLLSQSMDDLAFSKLGGMIFSKNRRGNDLLSC